MNVNEIIDSIFSLYSQKNSLLNELVYGKQMRYYDIQFHSEYEIWLYLHEQNPQILICLTPSNRRYIFDIRRIRIYKSNYRYEMDYSLKVYTYLVIEDFDEEIILVFGSPEEREKFYRQIKSVSIFLSNVPSEIDSVILKNFVRADINQNQVISLGELRKLLMEIKLCYDEELHEIVNFVQNGKEGLALNYREFQKLAKIIDCKKELRQLFELYSEAKINSFKILLEKSMKRSEFEEFLKQQQGETPQAIEEICKSIFASSNSRISFYQFCLYLSSITNSAIDLNYQEEAVDMSHPLTSYYCYSSHNTYLTGNQLTSDSRSQRYLEDLEEGIRCVEIDIHDGYGGPIVKHGYTATASIKFQDVIVQINEFRKEYRNHTPIILSLENHCNSENQYQMARIMEKHFKQSIIHINEYDLDHRLTLKECLGKVIIKCSGNLAMFNEAIGNNQSELMKEKQSQFFEEEHEEDEPVETPPNEGQIVEIEIQTAGFQKRREKFADKIAFLEEEKQIFQNKKRAIQKFIKESFKTKTHTKSKKSINLKLLSITSMLGGGKLGAPCQWESLSLNENKISNYFNSNKEKQIQSHTKKGWIRVYPKGSRFDSSNYNPLPSLESGCQIIALNTQNSDYFTHLMSKFFMKGINKTAGYRLKPDLSQQTELKTIKITPISATKIYFDDQEKKNDMPICEVKMRFYGLKKDFSFNTDQMHWKSYTEPITDNAYNPKFQRKKTLIVRYHCEQLAFVGVEIPECGIGILPLDGVRKGFRSVILYDEELKPKASKILVLIQK